MEEDRAKQLLAENLTKVLRRRKMSQEDLAKALVQEGDRNMSATKSRVSRIINQRHLPSISCVLAIAKVTKTRLDKFFMEN